MKKTAIILVLLAVFCGRTQAQTSPEAMWDKANTAYINADYDKAILYYDSIKLAGLECYKLYYNLGNAHFKKGNIGASILNYERASRLAPSDDDIKHNLLLANARGKDQIDEVPGFFLATWTKGLQRSVSGDTWAAISLAAFVVVLAALLLYFLSERMAIRKMGVYIALVGAVIVIFAFISGSAERRDIVRSSQAVVMSGAVAIKSSPDVGSKDIFILHEGTVVKTLEALNDWTEIMIADGRKGWIQTSAIEKI